MSSFDYLFLSGWFTLLLWYFLPRPIERGFDYSYDEETENTLINISEMNCGDSAYLAAIYRELRRQGRK